LINFFLFFCTVVQSIKILFD